MTTGLRLFRYEPRDFFVLRTPLLPIDELLRWGGELESPRASDDALEGALGRDHARLTERLRVAVSRPEVREAIYLASPDLYDRLPAWESGGLRDDDRARVTRSLVRYFTRMASRPTPFGLFAGVGIGALGSETRLDASTRVASRRVHLDMGYLTALMVRVQQDPATRARLRYQVNTSLSQSADRLHYIETHTRGAGRVYTLGAADASPEVCAVLRRAERPATLAELSSVLVAEDVDVDEATAFVNEMIDAQLLVSDLEPALTGTRSLDALCAQLEGVDEGAASIVSRASAALRDIEAAPIGVAPEAYARVRALLDELSVPSEAAEDVFQVDLRLDADLTLGTTVVDEIARAADCLFRIGYPEARPLNGFLKAFIERYELREVPLLEALDEEIGIGLPPEPPDPAREGASAAQQNAIMRLVTAALADGSFEIVLTDADVDAIAFRGPMVDLPPGYSMMVSMSAADPDAVRAGDFRLAVEGAAGPSGATILGRFCVNDHVLSSAVAGQLAAEEAMEPEALHAELVHLSEGRMGNVLARPVLRRYEIPFLGRSGAALDQQLQLDDLLVSVRDGRIVLRSRRHGREVVPHMTTAHNADLPDSPRVYRFLATFERQRCRFAFGMPWGALWELPFLPRVTYGRTVLSRARWTVVARDVAALVRAQGAERVRAVRAWRAKTRLPRYVQLKEGDNGLFVDFENPLCIDVLLELVKRRSSMTLVELLPTPDDAAVSTADGRFLHEILVPFVREPSVQAATPRKRTTSFDSARRPVARTFPPGSRCLYAKLYCGQSVADRVLRDLVAPLMEQVLGCGAAERWFYLRYTDPQPHLRLRFFGDPRRLSSEVLPALAAAAEPFIRDGRIWRLQLDTYEREVERYGGPTGVELAEQLFAGDSTAALALVCEYGGAAQAEQRALLTMAGIDRLYTDFGIEPTERVTFLTTLAPSAADFHRQQGDAYRRRRASIDSVLAGTVDPALAAGVAALVRRSAEVAPVVAALRAELASGAIDAPLESLLLSYTHMFVNRVESVDPNRVERQYYDFIRRFHVGRLARTGDRAFPRRTREEPAPALTY